MKAAATAIEHLVGQQPLLALAARLYLRPPEAALLPSLVALFPGQPDLAHVDLAAARQEYYDLFLVPVSGRYLPPFESAQRRQRLRGPLTYEVADFYRATGFDPAQLWPGSGWQPPPLPDHIGLELAFLSTLLQSYQEAAAGDRPALAETVHRFWQQHARPWWPAYGQALADTASSALYRFLGELTTELEG